MPIPREGANAFSGQFNFNGSNDSLQGGNYTDALQAAGLRAPFELINVYDVSAMYGGRIMRDKLWFYGVYRQVGGETDGAGNVPEQERRQSERLGGGLRSIPAGLQ